MQDHYITAQRAHVAALARKGRSTGWKRPGVLSHSSRTESSQPLTNWKAARAQKCSPAGSRRVAAEARVAVICSALRIAVMARGLR